MVKPKTILEIGVARGGSFRYWEALIPKGELLIGIDTDTEITRYMLEWWNFRESDRNIRLIIRDSLNQSTVQQVKQLLNGRKLDFLFIDGHHDPWWIFKEFERYGELVRYGGLIGFHDIRPEMNLQYIFDKIRGRTERYLLSLGIGIYWKEKLPSEPPLPLIFRARNLSEHHPDRAVLYDLDQPQSKRLRDIWERVNFDRWKT